MEPTYGELKRGDLVSLAKERGVKANGKSEAIVKVVPVALCMHTSPPHVHELSARFRRPTHSCSCSLLISVLTRFVGVQELMKQDAEKEEAVEAVPVAQVPG